VVESWDLVSSVRGFGASLRGRRHIGAAPATRDLKELDRAEAFRQCWIDCEVFAREFPGHFADQMILVRGRRLAARMTRATFLPSADRHAAPQVVSGDGGGHAAYRGPG
jgi:hypothetical protein